MAWGLRVWNGSGQVRLDTNDRITRLIHSEILAADSTGSIVIPGFDSTKGIAITTSLSSDPIKLAHQVRSDGNQVFWRASMREDSGTRITGTDSLLLVFMYA